MSFEITSDTVVKILVRRGLEEERKNTLLTEGEIGYSVDTKRVFIGDGFTPGGIPVSNKFLGFATDRNDYLPYAEEGDLIYDSNILYALDSLNNWISVHPKLYSYNGEASLEYSPQPNNELRLSNTFLGTGFTLSYIDDPSRFGENIQNSFGTLEFNANYISISGINSTSGSIYLGNILTKPIAINNNFNAKVNIENSLFINEHAANPQQIRVYAKDPVRNRSLIEATSGNFDIGGKNSLNLYATKLSLSANQLGTFSNPDVNVYGYSKFNNDLTIVGNLSVLGEMSFLDTVVTTTSSLCVINSNANYDSFVVTQNNVGNTNQYVMRIHGGNSVPYLCVKDDVNTPGYGIVCVNSYPDLTDFYNFRTVGNVYMTVGAGNEMRFDNGDDAGKTILVKSDSVDLQAASRIGINAKNSGTVSITGAGGVSILGNTTFVNGGVTITSGNLALSNGSLTVNGSIQAQNDIVAYATSDSSLKTNLRSINSLDVVDKLNCYKFKWTEDSYDHLKGKEDYGLLANEVEQVLPELVITREDGKKAVNYVKLIPILLDAIKKLKDNK